METQRGVGGLSAAAEAHAATRTVPAGVDLVLVPAAETFAACTAIANRDVGAAWGAPLRGEQMGLLLCPSARSGDDAAALRLLAGLASHGVRGLRLHVTESMASDELRGWAATIAGTGDATLPAGA